MIKGPEIVGIQKKIPKYNKSSLQQDHNQYQLKWREIKNMTSLSTLSILYNITEVLKSYLEQ